MQLSDLETAILAGVTAQMTDYGLGSNFDGVNGLLGGINTTLNTQIMSRIDAVKGIVEANNGLLKHAQYGLEATKNFMTKAKLGKLPEWARYLSFSA